MSLSSRHLQLIPGQGLSQRDEELLATRSEQHEGVTAPSQGVATAGQHPRARLPMAAASATYSSSKSFRLMRTSLRRKKGSVKGSL